MMAVALVSSLCLGSGASWAHIPGQTPEAAAETARWVVHSVNWGYLTTAGTTWPTAEVASYSDGAVNKSTGRIFFYLMGSMQTFAGALTVGEAAFAGTCGFGGTKIDPEDPRCAKITLSGSISKSSGADEAAGKAALFARHPQMETWPASHGFAVYELTISDIWMIDFYGGGQGVTPELFKKAVPKNNRPSWPPSAPTHAPHVARTSPPPWNQTAARARWLVEHSMWTAVSTTSVHLKGSPWGNVRSTADAVGSTGVPYFYLPSPDPTQVDVSADNHITLSFTEAALPERAGVNGTHVCGGMDAEDPTCARIHLSGSAVPLTSNSSIKDAEAALKAKHPLAPWLAQGGAHTGGKYYTIKIESIQFLDFYGGYAKLSVADYLAYKPTVPALAADDTSAFCDKVGANSGCCPACGYTWVDGKCATKAPASTPYCKLLTEARHSGCCVFCGNVWSADEGKCVKA